MKKAEIGKFKFLNKTEEIGEFKFLDKKENKLKYGKIEVKIDYFGWFRRIFFKSVELILVVLLSLIMVATFYYFYFRSY